jgi:polyketide biosynthesis enoyl-CoA hydratase PksI
MDKNYPVKLRKESHIAVVMLEEKEYKNTFTSRFIQGIKNAFASLRQEKEIKVVIVHGYDNYFCCGGTREELMQLQESYEKGCQTVQFTDSGFHDVFLRCEVPVIAALQGHALGAGLALGCTADIIVLGEQCIYSANFMKYGFTPGFGATYIIPKKLGELLGNEMLLTARNYYGQELKKRGAPVKIVPKHQVKQTAFEIARHLVDKPLISIKLLKKHMTCKIFSDFSEAVEKELEMHQITFGQPEVRRRIEELFRN